eukprot:m.6416 g.6416  ORF g.6416 m.6416 type:complete len:129 (-) comp8471_c0_seq1:78-464(-)
MANPNTVAKIFQQIQRVGFSGLMRNLSKEGRLMTGSLMGQDKFGNKYYEDMDQMFSQHRRVDYVRDDFNASQVPPEWHRWLQYMTDDVPNPEEPRKKWEQEHTENLTDSPNRYTPFSTVPPKIQAWKP